MKKTVIGAALAWAVLFIIVCIVPLRMVDSHPPIAKITREEIGEIRAQLEDYRRAHGAFPSEEVGLSFLPHDLFVKGTPEPKEVTDPWGTPFRYRLINVKPEIRSAGPDAQFDTADDITD